jgi:hypothetical protein
MLINFPSRSITSVSPIGIVQLEPFTSYPSAPQQRHNSTYEWNVPKNTGS